MQNKTLSEGGFVSVPLGSFFVRGGLRKDDRTQRYEFEYLKAAGVLDAKLVLKYGIADRLSGRFHEAPSSLRFDSFGAAYSFLVKLLEGLAMLGVDTGVINRENYGYYVRKVNESFSNAVKRELR